MTFPKNFLFLHKGEEALRNISIAAIQENDELSSHASTVASSMNLINTLSCDPISEDDDEKTKRLICIRIFNSCASSMKLALSGYYQKAVMIQRDMQETAFLLQYFKIHPEKVSEWSRCDEAERYKKFKPNNIRQALDDRDGFKDHRRGAEYKLMSSLGGHVSPQGFVMLMPKGSNTPHCGPFYDISALEAVLSELAKLSILAAMACRSVVKCNSQIGLEAKLLFAEDSGTWLEKFFGKKYDPSLAEDIKRLIRLKRLRRD